VWLDLFAAIALLLVIEGIMPFLNPVGFRQTLLRAAQFPDRVLRMMGFASMVCGVVLLYAVR
jgi:uncharacterized protein